MYEFDSVSVSSYEAASLAAKLSEKAADGWEVVAVVPAGNEVVAYVKRTAKDTASSDTAAVTTAAAADTTATTAAAAAPAASEPAGWGTAPASSSTGSSWGSSSTNDSGSSWGTAAAATTPTTPTQPAQPTTPAVPAGWYHDPAGRYELRYWDGSAWTEHVSRAGQQYTDPPVA
jgi:hypothetical protein